MPKRTKKPKSKLLRKEARAAYLYLIPAFIGLIVLTYIPLIAVFGLSFFKWGGTGAPEWNGINNYINTDDKFTISMGLSQLKGSLKTDWSAIMCGTCMSFVPGVVFYLLGQRYFVEGIVMTGMKN